MAKKENKYQSELIGKLESMFPESDIYPNDGNYIQGFPDITILHESGKWATLECKKSKDEPFQPNQPYYIEKHKKASYSAVIYPENEKEILNELQQTLLGRKTRVSKPK